jgi:hypothetical protein
MHYRVLSLTCQKRVQLKETPQITAIAVHGCLQSSGMLSAFPFDRRDQISAQGSSCPLCTNTQEEFRMIQIASTKPQKRQSFSELAILKKNRFRDAYHLALDLADKTPDAQQIAARSIIEEYFRLEQISPDAVLDRSALYFAAKPIKVNGVYKFLVPGTVKRELINVPLFLLRTKAALVEPLVEEKAFERATTAVEAVRLTLTPERVNGIISFIADAKQFYANKDTAGAERALGTALDHFNRATSEGLRRIKADAEKGKRSNEVAGSRRTLADLRKKFSNRTY